MAEMISSAVVGETVTRIISSLIGEEANSRDNMERLEMAHIKINAAIETSNKWCITEMSLLHWRKKLKRAAQECDSVLHKSKQRVLDDEETDRGVRQSTFPQRVVHTTKSFMPSFITRHKHEPSNSVVRRFERFAHGAGEFIRFVEFGGTPQKYMFFDSFIRHLLAGEYLSYKMLRGSQYQFFEVIPVSFEDHGLLAYILFFQYDCEVPEENYCLRLLLRLSESTDVIGTTIKCLQLVTPRFKPTAEAAMKELTQLPTQDFSYVPDAASRDTERWNFFNTRTQIFRPNSSCCKEYEHLPVERNLRQDLPPLVMAVVFLPHASEGDIHPPVESTVQEEIDGEEQYNTHTNVSLHELEEKLLPKAINFLYQTTKGTAYYYVRWISKHGSTWFGMRKAGTQTPSG